MQEEGLDTVDANRALGLPDDCREYSSVKNILKDLRIKSIRLMVRLASYHADCPAMKGGCQITQTLMRPASMLLAFSGITS